FNPSEDASPLERYERVRAAGESLVAKIMNHPSSKHFDPLRAASQMGIPVKQRTILFDSEDEMSALTDYSLHDFRPRGQSMMESCEWMPGDLTETEQAFMNAAMHSRTSLF